MFSHSQLEKSNGSGRGEILGRIDSLLALIQSEEIESPFSKPEISTYQHQKLESTPKEVQSCLFKPVQHSQIGYIWPATTNERMNTNIWQLPAQNQPRFADSRSAIDENSKTHKTIDLTKSPASEEKQPRDLLDAFQSLKQLMMLRSEDVIGSQAIETELKVLEDWQMGLQSNCATGAAEPRFCSGQPPIDRMKSSIHQDKYSSIATAVSRLGTLLTSEEQRTLWMQIQNKLLLGQSESSKGYFTFNHSQEAIEAGEKLACKDANWTNNNTSKEAQSLSTRHTNQSSASCALPAEQGMLRKSSSSRMNGDDTFGVFHRNNSREVLGDRADPAILPREGLLPAFHIINGVNPVSDSGYFSSLGPNSQFSFTPFATNLNSNDAGMRLDFFEMKKDRDLASGRGLSSRGHSYRKGEFQTQSEIEFSSPVYNSRKYQLRSPLEVENVPITVMSNNSQLYGNQATNFPESAIPQTDYKFIAKSPLGNMSYENGLVPPVATYLRFESSQERALPTTSVSASEVQPFQATMVQQPPQILAMKPVAESAHYDYNPWSNQDLSDYRNMFTGDTLL